MPDEVCHRLFNSPVETGLRALFVLDAFVPALADLQRLVAYDYLVVHSADVEGGPSSLHPAVPFRSGEWLVRRDVVGRSLGLMYSRELVVKDYSSHGIRYGASPLTRAFLRHLKARYATGLRDRAAWLRDRFGGMSDEELAEFMTANVGRWGAEFERQSAIRELEL